MQSFCEQSRNVGAQLVACEFANGAHGRLYTVGMNVFRASPNFGFELPFFD
jgi:hypothetical protein